MKTEEAVRRAFNIFIEEKIEEAQQDLAEAREIEDAKYYAQLITELQWRKREWLQFGSDKHTLKYGLEHFHFHIQDSRRDPRFAEILKVVSRIAIWTGQVVKP